MNDLKTVRDALERVKAFIGQMIVIRGYGQEQYSDICTSLATLDRMIETPAPTDISKSIHYPECWDTAAYPTVNDALAEMFAWFKCDSPEHAAPTPAPTEKVERIEGLEEALKASETYSEQRRNNWDMKAILSAASAYLKLQSATKED